MDDFLQDVNQNAAQPDLGALADDVDPASGEETPAVVTEQQHAEGDDGASSQPSQEDPALVMEQEHTEGGGVGTSSQPSEEGAASAMQQTEAGSCASCQPSEEESQSGTVVELSDS